MPLVGLVIAYARERCSRSFLYNGNVRNGFSTMNIIYSSLWSRLSVERLSSLIFISLVGPPLMQFNPLPCVKKWLAVHTFMGCL